MKPYFTASAENTDGDGQDLQNEPLVFKVLPYMEAKRGNCFDGSTMPDFNCFIHRGASTKGPALNAVLQSVYGSRFGTLIKR